MASDPVSTRSQAERRQPPFSRQDLTILLSITLLAAGLRLLGLGEWSFWVDEAHTVRDVTKPLDEFWGSHVSRYPLSYLILRGMLGVLPATSEGWLRLPFVFFGIAAIPAVAFVGRALVGTRAALIAALLLALSPWHVYWSQNCRSYSMVLFFSMLAMGAYQVASQQRSLLFGILSLALTVVAGLCHTSAYLVLAALIAFAGLSRLLSTGSAKADLVRRPLERWLPWIILGTILLLSPLLMGGLTYFQRAKPDFSLGHMVQTVVYFVRVPLILLAACGCALLMSRDDRPALFLMCWIVAPLVVLGIAASAVFKVTAQYAFYTLPAFCLLAGYAATQFKTGELRRPWLARAMSAVPLLIVLADSAAYGFLYYTSQHGDRPNWRAAKDWIEREPGRTKLVLTTNGPSMRYYLDPDSLKRAHSDVVEEILDWEIDKAGGPEAYLDAFMAQARRDGLALYVVLTEPELFELEPTRRLDSHLRTHFRQVRRYPVWTGPKDMTVLVYELPPPPGPPTPR